MPLFREAYDAVTLQFHNEAVEKSYLVFAYSTYVRNGTCNRSTAASLAISATVLLWKLASVLLDAQHGSSRWVAALSVLMSALPTAMLAAVLYTLFMKERYYPRQMSRALHETAMLGE